MLLLKRKDGWELFLDNSTKNNFLHLFAWVGVKAHFPLESPFSSFAEVSTSWITENKDVSSTIFHLMIGHQLDR